MMDFSKGAGVASNYDLIPNGQLAFAIVNVRGVKGSASGGQYIDVELTIDQGQPFAGRKVFEKVGDPMHPGNSEAYQQMGLVAITRMLEAGRNASPSNPAGYQIASYDQLNQLRVAIKIGVEPGSNGHDDKNRVSEFLTPNPQSQSGHKGWQALIAGNFNPTAAKAAPANQQGGFGGGFGGNTGAAQGGGFGGGATQQGFGGGNAGGFAQQPQTQQQGGFGQQQGFQQGQQSAGAQTAAGQSGQTGFASHASTTTSPSDPAAGQTPGWLAQASGQ